MLCQRNKRRFHSTIQTSIIGVREIIVLKYFYLAVLQYHPDATNDVTTQKKFVRILEAYNTLSKPHLRRDYDLGLIKPINGVRTTSPNFHQYDPQYER